MRIPIRALLAVAATSAAVVAPAAQAAVNCFGPNTMFVCLITPELERGTREECIFVGGTQCQEVTLPWYTLDGKVDVACGGALYCS